MPELPEVQAVVNHYKPVFLKQKIERISNPNSYSKVFATHTLPKLNKNVGGQLIKDVFRRGKYIVLQTEKGYLCIHLRMTGQLQESLDSFNVYRVQVNQSLIELRDRLNSLELIIQDTNNE